MSLNKQHHPELTRQPGSSALLNIDAAAFNKHKEERLRAFMVDGLKKDVHVLQKDMSEIKALLQQLVNGKSNG